MKFNKKRGKEKQKSDFVIFNRCHQSRQKSVSGEILFVSLYLIHKPLMRQDFIILKFKNKEEVRYNFIKCQTFKKFRESHRTQ